MTDARLRKDVIYMVTARLWSQRSTCRRLQVGAVLVKEGRIISTGYNGAPSGFEHCDPSTCNDAKPCHKTIHAEINTIVFAARYGISTEGAELFTTHAPCLDCAKAIVNAGIKKVTYAEEYRNSDGLTMLRNAGLFVQQMDIPEVVW